MYECSFNQRSGIRKDSLSLIVGFFSHIESFGERNVDPIFETIISSSRVTILWPMSLRVILVAATCIDAKYGDQTSKQKFDHRFFDKNPSVNLRSSPKTGVISDLLKILAT
jgi:hypothetical protein